MWPDQIGNLGSRKLEMVPKHDSNGPSTDNENAGFVVRRHDDRLVLFFSAAPKDVIVIVEVDCRDIYHIYQRHC